MIRKSGDRFSEKIMLETEIGPQNRAGGVSAFPEQCKPKFSDGGAPPAVR